nr:hypothetical protein GCM10025730_49620 [Promicromonospora thailandica]
MARPSESGFTVVVPLNRSHSSGVSESGSASTRTLERQVPISQLSRVGIVIGPTVERSTSMDKKAPSGNPSRTNPLPGCPMAAAFAAISSSGW